MTPAQEKKLDDLNNLCITMNGKFDVQDEKFRQHFQAIVDCKKTAIDQDTRIEDLEKDRNKAVGALAILTTGFIGTLVTSIISLFQSKPHS